jgi:hypothetical protein
VVVEAAVAAVAAEWAAAVVAVSAAVPAPWAWLMVLLEDQRQARWGPLVSRPALIIEPAQ